MKNKTPLIMGGIFLLLVVVFLMTSLNPRERSKGAEPLFEGEKPDITKLEIVKPDGSQIVVEEVDNIWKITEPMEYKASEEAVRQTNNTLLNMVVDGIISERTDARDRYEVSDSLGTRLMVYSAGEKVLDAIIGKNTVDLNHTYARMTGSDQISLWRGLLTSHVGRSVDEWRDKTIYSFNPDDILEVEAVTPDTTKVLAIQDSTWTLTMNGTEKPVDQNAVSDYISLLASLRCDAFADEKDIPRVAGNDPDTRVSFRVRNGDVHTFDLWTPGESDSGRYLIRKENGDEVFRFYRYRGERLGINYDRLKPAGGA